MEPYTKYKPTESRWFSHLPAQWNAVRAKWLFSNEKERSSDNEVQLAASQKYGVIPQSKMIKLNNAKVMLALKGIGNFKKIRCNDFVISLRSFEGGIEHSQYDGCISPAYTVLRFRQQEVVATYYKYALKSKNFIDALNSTSEGIRDGKTISYEQFGELVLALPSVIEQKYISAYLNRETTRIDSLIAEKQNFIKLLKEKRQALISHAFKYQESKQFSKLGHFVNLLSGFAFKSKIFSNNSSDIRLLRGANVGVHCMQWKDVVYWPNNRDSELHNYEMEAGDIVFGMDRPWISSGTRVAILKGCDVPSFLVQRVARIRARKGMLQEYIFFALSSEEFKAYAEADLTGVSVPHISPDQIKNFPIKLKSESEQLAIVKYLKKESQRIDSLIYEVETSIKLLSEHRTALISAAVTGKIDVRGLAKAPVR